LATFIEPSRMRSMWFPPLIRSTSCPPPFLANDGWRGCEANRVTLDFMCIPRLGLADRHVGAP
jgi:hypothetical protein